MQQNMMGQNIIITEPSKNLRALGRNALAGKWKVAILAMIVYELCVMAPPEILNELFGTRMDLYSLMYGTGVTMDSYLYSSGMYSSMPSHSFLSDVYTLLVTGAFELGASIFFLAAFRRQIVRISDIFLGFERFGKALGLMLFQTLFIVLWGLLFVVPGVIAAIRYSQAFFILADDPSKGIRQCMDESKMMMKGNKAKYFCLTISFFGWALLTVLPISIFLTVARMVIWYPSAAVVIVLNIITYLFVTPLTAYMYSAYVGFYEILAGHLIKETEPAPVHFDGISAAVPPAASSGGHAKASVVQPPVQSEPPTMPQRPAGATPVQPASTTSAQMEKPVNTESAQTAEPAAQPSDAVQGSTAQPFPQEATALETAKDAVSEAAHDDEFPKEV